MKSLKITKGLLETLLQQTKRKKHWHSKRYTENYRLCNTNLTNNRDDTYTNVMSFMTPDEG